MGTQSTYTGIASNNLLPAPGFQMPMEFYNDAANSGRARFTDRILQDLKSKTKASYIGQSNDRHDMFRKHASLITKTPSNNLMPYSV